MDYGCQMCPRRQDNKILCETRARCDIVRARPRLHHMSYDSSALSFLLKLSCSDFVAQTLSLRLCRSDFIAQTLSLRLCCSGFLYSDYLSLLSLSRRYASNVEAAPPPLARSSCCKPQPTLIESCLPCCAESQGLVSRDEFPKLGWHRDRSPAAIERRTRRGT
jgi:hypothetical protein